MKLRVPAALLTSEREYRANLAGLNMFFGAVLGFVITGIDQLGNFDFAQLLIVCSAIVMCILYVPISSRRWLFIALGAVMILLLERLMPDGIPLPPKLQPTLAVWLALAVIIEAMPRKPSEQEVEGPEA